MRTLRLSLRDYWLVYRLTEFAAKISMPTVPTGHGNQMATQDGFADVTFYEDDPRLSLVLSLIKKQAC